MTTFTSWDGELCHYGIPGMKWGVRRFQNEDGTLTARGLKRYGDKDNTPKRTKLGMQYELNNLAQIHANAEATLKSDYKKYMKIHKKNESVSNEKKREKNEKKLKKLEGRMEKTLNATKEIDKLTWRALASALNNGYNVNSKQVRRYGITGKNYAAQIIGGAAGNALYTIATAKNHYVNSELYTLKKRKSGNPEFTQTIKA